MKISTKLKTGDKVIVISGKHKGSVGELLKLNFEKNRCFIKGVAMAKLHKRATKQDEKSEIIQREASINLSNVAYYDEKAKKAVKIGYKIENNKKLRYNKASKEVIG